MRPAANPGVPGEENWRGHRPPASALHDSTGSIDCGDIPEKGNIQSIMNFLTAHPMRPMDKIACRRFRVYVAATDSQLRDLLLLIGTQAVVLCEQLDVTTDKGDGHTIAPFRKITFATPSYLFITTYQITDWLMSLSLFGGRIAMEDFLQ